MTCLESLSNSVIITLNVDKLLLRKRLPVDGVSSVLSNVFLDEAAFKYLVGDRGDAGVLRYLV